VNHTYTVTETARLTGIPRETVQRYCREGLIEAVRVGRGYVIAASVARKLKRTDRRLIGDAPTAKSICEMESRRRRLARIAAKRAEVENRKKGGER
jgi:excisionase family DNA binding protein